MNRSIDPVTPFAFWLDRPFKPGQVPRRSRYRRNVVTIRYHGSVSRSVFKVLTVLAFISVMAAV